MTVKYGIDDKPGLGPLLLYGLQWWVVSLPCLVIMGAVVARMHYSGLADQIFYMQRLFALMGALTAVQALWGHRLPLVVGPATTLLVGLVATASSGINATYTAIISGGLIIAVLAFSGLLARLRFFFTPRIVSVILVLIAFTLSPTILNLLFSQGQHAEHLAFALLFVLALLLCNVFLPGVWKSLTLVIGMSAGALVYFGYFGGFPGLSEPGAALESSLFISGLDFNAGVILSFLFCFLALLINELGSIESVGQLLGADKMDSRIRRGAGLNGLANMAAGGLGLIGPVDFSLSAGVIASTGCASRYTLVPAGIALAACAFIPFAAQALSAIPDPVMGAILLYLMSTQLASGLGMLIAEKGISDFNSGIIVSLPLMVGLVISFAPAEAFAGLNPLFKPVIANGFVMGTITVIILEHLIFRKRQP